MSQRIIHAPNVRPSANHARQCSPFRWMQHTRSTGHALQRSEAAVRAFFITASPMGDGASSLISSPLSAPASNLAALARDLVDTHSHRLGLP